MYNMQETPLSFSELLRKVFSLWRVLLNNLWPLALGIAMLMIALSPTLFVHDYASFHRYTSYVGATTAVIWLLLLGWLYTLFYQAAGQCMNNAPVVWSDLLKSSLLTAPKAWLAFLLYFLLLSAGLICFVLPGIYLYVAGWFAVPLCIIMGYNVMAAFRASFQLVKNNWWRSFGLFFVISAVVFFISFCLHFFEIRASVNLAVKYILDTAVQFIIICLNGAATLVLLQELSLRNPYALHQGEITAEEAAQEDLAQQKAEKEAMNDKKDSKKK